MSEEKSEERLITSKKVCSYCKDYKDKSQFYNNYTGRTKDQLGGWCKECLKIYNNRKNKTFKGVLQTMLSSMRRRSKSKGYLCNVSLEDLIVWAESNGYEDMYHRWKESGYLLEFKPTPDRTDALKPYTLDNMTLMTYKENTEKGRYEVTTAHKGVEQILDGVVVSTYTSISSASTSSGIEYSNISRVCNGKRNSAGGFQWRFTK